MNETPRPDQKKKEKKKNNVCMGERGHLGTGGPNTLAPLPSNFLAPYTGVVARMRWTVGEGRTTSSGRVRDLDVRPELVTARSSRRGRPLGKL